jgi:HEAT repeat protein
LIKTRTLAEIKLMRIYRKATSSPVKHKADAMFHVKGILGKKPAFYLLLLCVTVMALTGCEQQVSQLPDAASVTLTESLAPLNAKATQIVREALVDSSPITRTNAIEVVAAGRKTELMPIVVALVNDDSVPVRFALAIAVGDLRYYGGKKTIIKLLQDKDQNVRIAAAYALTKLGEGDYTRMLRDAIRSEDKTVRANAVLLLGLLGNKDALNDLYWTLRAPDCDDKTRLQAVEAIAMLGDDKIYRKLWAMLISAYVEDKIMGIKAMGALGTPQAGNALITMLDDEIVEVRLAAAEQLGALGQRTGEAEVLDFLRNPYTKDDPLAEERRNTLAARAIARIGTPRLVNFLPALLKNESIAVRLAAARAVFILQQ